MSIQMELHKIIISENQEQQIIVATHDEEFEKALRTSLPGEGVVVYTLDWSPRAGARITGS